MHMTAEVNAGASDIHALAAVGTTPDCDSAPGDNHTSVTVQVGDAQGGGAAGSGGSGPAARDREVDVYEPGGGCGCTLAETGPGAAGWAEGALGLAMLWWTRRRRRAS